ncbi:MAG: tyrosine-type recombinase/integrase [Gaiellaceae bacterium]
MTRRTGSVVVYEGARGRVFRLRYRDADGERIVETLGAESDGWTATKAEAELRDRLVDVKRERRRKIKPESFEDFALRWLETYPAARGLKRSTTSTYTTIVKTHLVPALGDLRLELVDVDRLERYIADKRKAGASPATINRHLNLLNLLFTAAIKRNALPANANPVPLLERPKEPRRRWTILTPAEIARVAAAFDELAAAAPAEPKTTSESRAWIEQARVVFLLVVACGLRRGEVLGLRWRHVDLVDMVLRVEETWVLHQVDTPKSESGERTIAFEQTIAELLWQHRGRTSFQGDDERVVCHPTKGTPLDTTVYAETLRAALKRAKIARRMRPFHDGRHTAITNDAAAGNAPLAIQTRAGHASFSTTQRYIDLAGVSFRDEAGRLDRHLFGNGSGKSSGKSAEDAERELDVDG